MYWKSFAMFVKFFVSSCAASIPYTSTLAAANSYKNKQRKHYSFITQSAITRRSTSKLNPEKKGIANEVNFIAEREVLLFLPQLRSSVGEERERESWLLALESHRNNNRQTGASTSSCDSGIGWPWLGDSHTVQTSRCVVSHRFFFLFFLRENSFPLCFRCDDCVGGEKTRIMYSDRWGILMFVAFGTSTLIVWMCVHNESPVATLLFRSENRKKANFSVISETQARLWGLKFRRGRRIFHEQMLV